MEAALLCILLVNLCDIFSCLLSKNKANINYYKRFTVLVSNIYDFFLFFNQS